jgi:hypothetical protein
MESASVMKNVVRKLKHQPDNFVVRIYGHYNLNCKAVQQLKTLTEMETETEQVM